MLGGYALGNAAGFTQMGPVMETAASLLCIGGIAGLATQKTARLGNTSGIAGITLGLAATLGGASPCPPAPAPSSTARADYAARPAARREPLPPPADSNERPALPCPSLPSRGVPPFSPRFPCAAGVHWDLGTYAQFALVGGGGAALGMAVYKRVDPTSLPQTVPCAHPCALIHALYPRAAAAAVPPMPRSHLPLRARAALARNGAVHH